MVISADQVMFPDSLKLNDVNIFLSIIFYKKHLIKTPPMDTYQVINGLSSNSSTSNIPSNGSYSFDYLSYVCFILNRGKNPNQSKSKPRVSSNSSGSNGNPNVRSFSSARPQFIRVLKPEHFESLDAFVLYMARAHITDY